MARNNYGLQTYSDDRQILGTGNRAGLGPGSAGQSGDTQGLPNEASADSESVVELVESGQYMEAELVDAIEQASDPDVREVHTRQVHENDVPQEYLDSSS